ncbi:MAG: hypothetical protein PHP85_11560 [Gallionella sp.]|nr:hypothetical protein [Gallionella sp.]
MKTVLIVLGIIGSLIGLGGGIMTVIGGFGGTAVGLVAENNGAANSGAFVLWSGLLSIVVSALALICSLVGGTAKKKNVILIFAFATLVCGLLDVYLYNWFSGSLISIGGLLGLVGAKEGIVDQQDLRKSPLMYITAVFLVVLAVASILIKNGKSVIETNQNETAASVVPAPIGSSGENASSPNSQIPFIGSRTFNFDGGSGTGQSVTIKENGRTLVQSYGTSGTFVDYEGFFSNPINLTNGTGLLFKNDKIYLLSKGVIEKGCKEEGRECVANLYPSEEIQAPAPILESTPVPEANSAPVRLSLASALADKNAIVCRFNESEDMCIEVDQNQSLISENTPEMFAAKKGYKTIYGRETIDDSITNMTYLKMIINK